MLANILILTSGEQQLDSGDCGVEFSNSALQLILSKSVELDPHYNDLHSENLYESVGDDVAKDMAIVYNIDTYKQRNITLYKELLELKLYENLENHLLSVDILNCLGFPLLQGTDTLYLHIWLPINYYRNHIYFPLKDDSNKLINVSPSLINCFQVTHSNIWNFTSKSKASSFEKDHLSGTTQLNHSEEIEDGECSSSDEEDERDMKLSINGHANEIVSRNDKIISNLLSEEVLAELSGRKLRLCAIDCEMCTTKDGLEVTRISIISPEISSFVLKN